MAAILHLLKTLHFGFVYVRSEGDLMMKYNHFSTIWASEEANSPYTG